MLAWMDGFDVVPVMVSGMPLFAAVFDEFPSRLPTTFMPLLTTAPTGVALLNLATSWKSRAPEGETEPLPDAVPILGTDP